MTASLPAVDRPWLIPPVDAPVVRPFEAPSSRWGPGHRGIDYDLEAGLDIRAAADGSVAFAGSVAGTTAITIEHGGGLETTYSQLSEAFVERGEVVGQGQFIGRTGRSHPGTEGGLHFGVKLVEQYVDPELYLGPLDVGEAIHLVPTSDGTAPPAARQQYGTQVEGTTVACTLMEDAVVEGEASAPPNDNLAVVVGGITSEYPGAGEPEVYPVPEALGYPANAVFRFSYSGKETYRRQDTFIDLRVAAGRLGALVREVGRRFPGRGVDLFAHSQGGLVAREFLKGYTTSWNRETPRVEHLITFASPHLGAPLADQVDDVEGTASGELAVEVMADIAETDGYLPDPHGASTQQMRPGSNFLAALADEDVLYGTRVLTLTMPYDFIVPVDHSRWPGQLNRVVPGSPGFHHRMVVESRVARGLARSFLRDAAEPCRSDYDDLGLAWGSLITSASGAVDWPFLVVDAFSMVTGVTVARKGLAVRAIEAGGALPELRDEGALGALVRATAVGGPAATILQGRTAGLGGRLIDMARRGAGTYVWPTDEPPSPGDQAEK